MAEPLWTWAELVDATGGEAEGKSENGITGVSIDTRTLAPGDLFVALRGDNQDGHAYVAKAFAKSAAAALVAADFVTPAGAGPLIRVDDTLRGLERLGRAARARLSPEARVIAVTGSVGKTSTKEMLRVCLSSVDPRTHASEKSYNNHWGVPLTLARMPADTRYGVFEIGMNHAGEIARLSPMVRPHVAIITTVGPVHLEFFKSVEEIADAKAEIFQGLEAGGVAVLNANNQHINRLREWALKKVDRADVHTFGKWGGPTEIMPDSYLVVSSHISPEQDLAGEVSQAMVSIGGLVFAYQLGAIGAHHVMNSLAALTAVKAVGIDPTVVLTALREFVAQPGRGEQSHYRIGGGNCILIDESYNANPLSVVAALETLSALKGEATNQEIARLIAVLGEMRELGDDSARLHSELNEPIAAANVNLVFACGPLMRYLCVKLSANILGAYVEGSTDLIAPLLAAIRPGDVVMVKGSLGTNMKPIVEALKAHLEGLASAQAQ